MSSTTSMVSRLRDSATSRYSLPLIAVFLAVLGSRLWLIRTYGSDVPFWDQWGAEASLLYKPMLERGYGAVDWFAAHNEHRIVLARVMSAVMLIVNGQWDPLLQVCWAAFCAAMIATLLGVSATRLMPGDRAIVLVLGLVLIGLTMPYGWANTLVGFASPFYYLILLALSMFHLCAYRGLLTRRRSVVVGLLGALSLLTIASGTLVCLAAACSLAARLAFARQADTRRVSTLAFALVLLAALGLATTPKVAGHEALQARDLPHFLTVFNIVLGWPSTLGWVVWLPFAAWCLRLLRKRRIDAPGLYVVGLAAFVLLNAAATATSRAAPISDVSHLASRYTDIAWCAWLVNLMAALLLVRRRNNDRSTVARRLFVLIVFLGAAVELAQAGLSGLTGATQLGGSYALSSANTRSYIATNDPAALRDKPAGSIPYPYADQLMQLIDDPTIRALLPPGVRQGVLARSGASPESLAGYGLVLTGVPPGIPMAPAPYLGQFYGTWGKNGEHTVRFVSAPIRAQGPAVHTLVSGYLGRTGSSLYVEDVVSGKRVDLVPDRPAGANWTSVRATIPGATYRLVVEDTATGDEGWFAFTDPVESGRLRGVIEYLVRIGEPLTLFGLALFLVSILIGPLASRNDDVVDGV